MQDSWSTNQRKFQEWLATPRYERIPPTHEGLAKELGLNPSTLYRWKQDPKFVEAVNAIARKHLGDDLPEVFGALIREAKKGSHQHIKMYLELVGEYVEPKDNSGELILKVVYGDQRTDSSTS